MKTKLSKEDSALNESNRVLGLIKKYKVTAEQASRTGILARANKGSENISKSTLKGLLPDQADKKKIEELI
jgi:hypothetical protein